jgi:polar amino acid transport system substrate-binding protein
MDRMVSRTWAFLFILITMGHLLQGCGLLMDAAQLVRTVVPGPSDELDVICEHGRLQVGIAIEAFPPFVFPVIWTDQGPRVTGLDIELVQEITRAFSRHCGGSTVTAVPHMVHFRDLFRLLTEGHLDLFVSSVSYNVPHLTASGLGYSTPYYYDAGISGITRRPEVVEQVRAALSQPAADAGLLAARKGALTGLIVAVQEGRSPHLYAEANLKGIRLLLCDTLAAALQFRDPAVDVILGKQPILDYILRKERTMKKWQPLVLENGQPFLLNRELFTVVMAENSFRLQWLVNDVLFELEESGRLAAMRRRWLDEDYVFHERATSEGLLSDMPQSLSPYVAGRCHWAEHH